LIDLLYQRNAGIYYCKVSEIGIIFVMEMRKYAKHPWSYEYKGASPKHPNASFALTVIFLYSNVNTRGIKTYGHRNFSE
jgi:hypothetical protein